MIEDEIREILAALVADTGSLSAAIVADDGHSGVPSKRRPLGGDRSLQVELSTRTPKAQGEGVLAVDAILEIAVRQLRAAGRRWNVDPLPLLRMPPPVASADRVMQRLEAFLSALAGTATAQNAMVLRRGQLVASASPVDESWKSRLAFLAKRTAAAATDRTSHGEIVDPDAYALGFYYDAVLVVAIDAPYAVDFLRHRCRMVARELALLLPMLDPDPETPAATRPPT